MTTILIPDKVRIEGNTVYASGDWNGRSMFYSALLRCNAVDLMGNIINRHAFDAWMQKHSIPAIGQDSAMEVADDYQS